MITNITALLAYINQYIYANGRGAITGPILATVLTAIVVYFATYYPSLNSANIWTGSQTYTQPLTFPTPGLTGPLDIASGGTGVSVPGPNRQFDPVSFGAICDGNNHFLSTITQVNFYGLGLINTSHYTLAQWQILYPTIPQNADLSTIQIDGVAISATYQTALLTSAPYTISRRNSKCLASTSINWTGATSSNVYIDFTGTTITSTAANVPAVDMTLTGFAHILSLSIIGDCTNEPVDGLRWVRPYVAAISGNNVVYNLVTEGCFKVAGFRNMGSEDNILIDPIIANRDTNGGFPVIYDGHNHYNAASTAAVGSNGQTFQNMSALVVDTQYYSMTSNTMQSPRIVSTSSAPLWLSGTRTFSMTNGYLVNNTPSSTNKNCVTLYETSDFPDVNTNLEFLCEPYNATMPYTFFVTGKDSTPILDGFHFNSMLVWGTVSAIGTDSTGGINGSVPITAAIFNGYLSIPLFSNFSLNPTVFDQPLLWSGVIEAHIQQLSEWTPLTGPFTGEVCAARVCTYLNPTESLNANGVLVYDQPLEHTLTTPVVGVTQVSDNWESTENGSTSGKLTFVNENASACNLTYFDELLTVGTALTNIAATDAFSLRTMIRSTDLFPYFWGRGPAQPLIADYWLDTNYTGTVAVYATNYVGNQVVTHDVAVTPGCHEYLWLIPPFPGVTGFPQANNYVGVHFGISPTCGTNFQVAPDAWTSTGGMSSACTANTGNFLATVGNYLKVSSVNITGGYFRKPVQQWTDEHTLSYIHQQYIKSVPAGVAPSYQNQGLTGAFTFTANASGTTTVPIPGKLFTNAGTAPTVKLFSTGAASGNCYDITAGADGGAATASNISDGSFRLTCASTTTGHEYGVNYTIQGQQ